MPAEKEVPLGERPRSQPEAGVQEPRGLMQDCIWFSQIPELHRLGKAMSPGYAFMISCIVPRTPPIGITPMKVIEFKAEGA